MRPLRVADGHMRPVSRRLDDLDRCSERKAGDQAGCHRRAAPQIERSGRYPAAIDRRNLRLRLRRGIDHRIGGQGGARHPRAFRQRGGSNGQRCGNDFDGIGCRDKPCRFSVLDDRLTQDVLRRDQQQAAQNGQRRPAHNMKERPEAHGTYSQLARREITLPQCHTDDSRTAITMPSPTKRTRPAFPPAPELTRRFRRR